MRCAWGYMFVWLSGCGNVVANTSMPPDASDASSVDAARGCDPTTQFGPPVPIAGLAIPGVVAEHGPRLSADELTLYFSGVPANSSDVNLYVARRNSLTEAFGQPTPLTSANSSSIDIYPTVTGDGLTLWFASNRVAGQPNHLYVATRASTLAEFGPPALAATINSIDSTQVDTEPFVIGDGQELWFASSRPTTGGKLHLWHAARSGSDFAAPVMASELNTGTEEQIPMLSADRRTIYFSSPNATAGSKGGFDIWQSRRDSDTGAFPAPQLVEELNTSSNDYATWLSLDACRIYGFSGDIAVNSSIFMATRQK